MIRRVSEIDGPRAAGASDGRSIGLVRATGIGVGAIVGGGVLALAGVAFATTGAGAIVAFALNGLIALVTVHSFAALGSRFPESGGTYVYARKVMGVEAAFMVGWVVWFASIAAAVLYALGFGAYLLAGVRRLAPSLPSWVGALADHPWALAGLALAATAGYTSILLRRAAGGGEWSTVGKVVVFVVIILGGLWAVARQAPAVSLERMTPLFPNGGFGLLQAMGYTFIALQGYDLVAAVGGEIKDPRRNLPRAMYLSLAIAMVIYLPFLFVVTVVGVSEGESVQIRSLGGAATFIADAVETFLGPAGTWLVIVAALLSMLSALHANLMASSRIAMAMARDRTLAPQLGTIDVRSGSPSVAVLVTAALVAVILVAIPNVSAAGAASSLIFLVSFGLVHLTAVLARRRSSGAADESRRELVIPGIGLLACLGLALFQGVAVPSAGVLAIGWLAAGSVLYFVLFAHRARVVDASAEARDPSLVQLRGHTPLVLVPIARPSSARAMVEVASALTPPGLGRVLLLSVVRPPDRWQEGAPPQQLVDAQTVLGESLTASFAASLAPQALTAVSREPWQEIARVAQTYRCESLLLGLGSLDEASAGSEVERLATSVRSDVVILRAPPGWSLRSVRRVLLPVGGRRDQSELRARLLGSLSRGTEHELTFLRVVPPATSEREMERIRVGLMNLAQDEAHEPGRVEVVQGESFEEEVARRASESDLLVLGLQRQGRRRVIGRATARIAAATNCAMILISRS
jgi:amino acid transporter